MTQCRNSVYIPDAFVDHILTGELMVDPVMAEDNRTYDRAAIVAWIEAKRSAKRPLTSPLTRELMGPTLRPNVDIKRAIDDLRDEMDRNEQSKIETNC